MAPRSGKGTEGRGLNLWRLRSPGPMKWTKTCAVELKFGAELNFQNRGVTQYTICIESRWYGQSDLIDLAASHPNFGRLSDCQAF